jgi:hypothetical protein
MYSPVLRAGTLELIPHNLCHRIQRCVFVRWLHGNFSKPDTDVSNRAYTPIIIFIEIPLLLRICPTSPKFDAFIRRFGSNYMRAAIYFVMSVVQWISIWPQATGLIAAAVVLLAAATFYALAGIKGQAFQGSKTLGGQGVAQMII